VICPNTVKRVLGDHEIEPALKKVDDMEAVSECALGHSRCDRLLLDRGLDARWALHHLHAVCNRSLQRIYIVGSTHCPNELSTHLAALALTEFGDSPLKGATHLIMDRDIKPPSGFEKCFKRMASNQSSSLLVLPI
jgi:hypothetical protein